MKNPDHIICAAVSEDCSWTAFSDIRHISLFKLNVVTRFLFFIWQQLVAFSLKIIKLLTSFIQEDNNSSTVERVRMDRVISFQGGSDENKS